MYLLRSRYANVVGGSSWGAVQRFLGSKERKPTTIEGWIATAEAVRNVDGGSAAMAA